MADIGNYITKDGLPGDLRGNLEMATANVGAGFLAGEAANLLKKPANIASNAMEIYNTVTDVNLLKELTVGLAEHCVTITVNELTSYITDKTTDLLSIDKMQDALVSSVTYWTSYYILKPEDILKLVQPKDSGNTIKDTAENQKNTKFQNMVEKVTEIVGTCKDYVDKTVGALDEGISTIAAYVSMGPDWVVTTTNSYLDMVINKAEGFIGEKVAFAERCRDTAIDVIGNGVGYTTASIANGVAILAAKAVKSATEKLIAEAQVKVQNALTKAIMTVRQITGIAIPPVYPKLPKLTSLLK